MLPGDKEQLGRDADPSPPSSAMGMKGYSYTSTPPMGHMACTVLQCLYRGAQLTVMITAQFDSGHMACTELQCLYKGETVTVMITAQFDSIRLSSGIPIRSFWLQIQRSRVRFPALPDFLSSSGSGTGSTQPRKVN